MPSTIRWPVTIHKIEERYRREYTGGIGAGASFQDVSTGWWVVFDHGETRSIGDTKPEGFAPGDRVWLTMEKLK